MEGLEEALALVRRALEIVDASDDPYQVGPHLDLVVQRLTDAAAGAPRNDNANGASEP
jgi:hypothetical protein